MAHTVEELDVLVRQLQGLAAASDLTLPPLNNWIGTVHYCKVNGVVHVWAGDDFNAQVPATSVVCAQLPPGFRPSGTLRAPLTHFRGSSGKFVPGSVTIAATGNISLYSDDNTLSPGTASGHSFAVAFYAG